MKNKKHILLVTILILLIFLVTGCSGFFPKPTKGVISGRVLIPPTARELSRDISGWVPAAGAEVTIVDANGVKHTVITDENGYYSFENIAVKANTVVTATVKVDGKTVVLKGVIPQGVAEDEDYNTGTMTPESTALALVIEKLIAEGKEQADIDLGEVQGTESFAALVEQVETVIEEQGNVTEDPDVTEGVEDTAEEIITPPTPPVPTPPSGPSTIAVRSVSIEGNITIGELLTAEVLPAGTTVNYQWLIAEEEIGEYEEIEGATTGTYIPVLDDIGKYIKIKVEGTGHYTGGKISAAVGPVWPEDSTVFNVDKKLGYISIHTAIDEADEGDTLLVGPGNYEITQNIILKKGVTIKGTNVGMPGDSSARVEPSVIKPNSVNTGNLSLMVDVQTSNVTIDGIDFVNVRINGYENLKSVSDVVIKNNVVSSVTGTAIHFRDGSNAVAYNSSRILIQDNKISDTVNTGGNSYDGGSGIVVFGVTDSEIIGNVVKNCGYIGIQLARDKDVTVRGNTIDHSAQPAVQVAQWNSGTITISQNTLSTSSNEKGVVRLYGFTNNHQPTIAVTDNTIEDSKLGIQIGHGDSGKKYDDIKDAEYNLTGNTFDNIAKDKLVIYLSSEASDDEKGTMDELFKEVYGEEYQARAVTTADPFKYVVSILAVGEGLEFPTIQEAINSAANGDTIVLFQNITLTERVILNKQLVLDGNDRTITTTADPNGHKLYLEANGITVKNVTITGTARVGIDTKANIAENVTIENVTFIGTDDMRIGFYANKKVTGIIEGCTFEELGIGIGLDENTEFLIQNNVFADINKYLEIFVELDDDALNYILEHNNFDVTVKVEKVEEGGTFKVIRIVKM